MDFSYIYICCGVFFYDGKDDCVGLYSDDEISFYCDDCKSFYCDDCIDLCYY